MPQTAAIPAAPPHHKSPRRSSGWSPERRVKHAAAIRRWRPWAKSTGPRTAAGKARSAQNALKSGEFSRAGRIVRSGLTLQRRYLGAWRTWHALKAKNPQNELLNGMHAMLLATGPAVAARLALGLAALKAAQQKEDERRLYRHKLELSPRSGILNRQYV